MNFNLGNIYKISHAQVSSDIFILHLKEVFHRCARRRILNSSICHSDSPQNFRPFCYQSYSIGKLLQFVRFISHPLLTADFKIYYCNRSL